MTLRTVTQRDGTVLVPIEEHETAALMRTGRTVSLAFGTGGAALKVADCPWAIPILEKLRGLTFEEGDGI